VKYLFVLALFAVAAFMLYWRMRPYIRGVRRFLGVVREVNRMSAGARRRHPRFYSAVPAAPGRPSGGCPKT